MLHLVDLVTGAHLEWNTVFGYSPTIGIRFVGLGNLTFAQLVAAAVLFAGSLAWRVAPPRGVRIALGVLAGTVVVMGVPFWGADFGSVLSAVPAFALMGWLLLGRRLRCAACSALVGAGVGRGAGGGAGRRAAPGRGPHPRRPVLRADRDDFGGAARDPSQGGREPLGDRPLGAALAVFVRPAPRVPVVGRGGRPLRGVLAGIPTTGATVVGFSRSAVLGFVLNDSGITIPGMMWQCCSKRSVVADGHDGGRRP